MFMHKMLPFINETWLFSFFVTILSQQLRKNGAKNVMLTISNIRIQSAALYLSLFYFHFHTQPSVSIIHNVRRVFFSLRRKYCSKLQLSDKNCFALFQNHFECKEKQWQKKYL